MAPRVPDKVTSGLLAVVPAGRIGTVAELRVKIPAIGP
jgi:hypothetical protein